MYPQTPDEWACTIWYSLGIDKAGGEALAAAGEFPYRRLALWIQETYTEGYAPEFVPALLRNLRGLVSWVYSGAPEPDWRGADPIRETGELY